LSNPARTPESGAWRDPTPASWPWFTAAPPRRSAKIRFLDGVYKIEKIRVLPTETTLVERAYAQTQD
jgi:hypothetical protein